MKPKDWNALHNHGTAVEWRRRDRREGMVAVGLFALFFCALLFLMVGCQTVPAAPAPVVLRDDVTPLLQHPQFQSAAKAAPDFTRAALKKVAELDRILNTPSP